MNTPRDDTLALLLAMKNKMDDFFTASAAEASSFSTFITTPAKVNLGLKIVRRREDGYHEIRTVMEPISLVDTIFCEFTEAAADSFSLESPQMMDFAAADNLVVRAARKMVAAAHEQGVERRGHWHFWLEKRIPAGAGLGGGSSNAAGVLNLLKDFYELELTAAELNEMAVQLGADIPFFLRPELALVEGIGERLTPLPPGQRRYYLLVKPSFSINTGWAYAALNASAEKSSVEYDIGQFSRKSDKSNYLLENDFELPVMSAYPQITEIKAWLEQSPGALGALLSGSGSVVYAIYADLKSAIQAEAAARREWRDSDCDFFLARNL